MINYYEIPTYNIYHTEAPKMTISLSLVGLPHSVNLFSGSLQLYCIYVMRSLTLYTITMHQNIIFHLLRCNSLHLGILELTFSWNCFNNNNMLFSMVTHLKSSSSSTRLKIVTAIRSLWKMFEKCLENVLVHFSAHVG